MNLYDPADYIVYVPMDRQLEPTVTPGPRPPAEHRLPDGYANASPRTRLRSGTRARPPAALRPDRAS